MPTLLQRISRHFRLSREAARRSDRFTPPFLIVFINSICNLTCEHCFYWESLNQKDDLTFEEFDKLTAELGQIENLYLSGGEPFLRPEFAEIVELFLTRNGVKQVYVPTNGYFTERTEAALRKILKSKTLQLFACEISLDGMPEYHNRFRGNPKSFEKAMETYEMLSRLQVEDPRLRIHSISTATNENLEELRQLTDYLFANCPKMDHHNLAIIRGDRKNPSLGGPALDAYDTLYRHLRETWAPREQGRFGGIIDPLLNHTKRKTIDQQTQVVPCKAGRLSGVVHANGEISFCETHEPLGSLRKQSFFDIWDSPRAKQLRDDIAAKKCFCTNEIFMWPSIAFQPMHLARAMVGSRVWSV
jgi:MoaA/NifB/PqqE/SkfB family radical SAM enzyme